MLTMNQRRRILFRILLALASLVVCLALAELAVRALPYLPMTAMGAVMRVDPVLDHCFRPNAVGRMRSREYDVMYRINSVGLRDDEPRPRGYLLLGDSFMEGYGVARGKTLADLLRARGLNIVNAGMKSYSPLLEYLFLKHRGLALEPDTVVLFLDLTDVTNDEFYGRRLVTDAAGEPLAVRPRQLSIPWPSAATAEFLGGHSVLYAYLEHLAYKHFPASKDDLGYAGGAPGDDFLLAGRDAISDTEYYPHWTATLSHLKRIRDLCRAHGKPFLLVTYPYAHQISPKAWTKGRVGHGFTEAVASDRPFRFVERWAAGESIPVLSLDGTFKAHPAPETLFFDWDGHWTEKGHALAADEVYKRLSKMQ